MALCLTNAAAELTGRGFKAAIDISQTTRSWTGHGKSLSFTVTELAETAGTSTSEAERFSERFSLDFDGTPLEFGELTTRARHRPLLRDGGRLMSISVPSLRRSIRRSLGALLNPRLPEAGQGDKKAFSIFTAQRGNWLEQKSVGALGQALRPDWMEQNLHFELSDRRRGEIDGLLRIDDTLLVVQAKAGVTRLDTEAANPERFRETLVGLLGGENLRQHRDGAEALKAEPPTLSHDQAGEDRLLRSFEGISRILPLHVTLDDVSGAGAQPWLLIDAGIATSDDLPWIVGIGQLELLLEFFELPAVFLHFLTRRQRANRSRQLLATDEIDRAVRYGHDELVWADLPLDHPHAQRQFVVLEEDRELDQWQLARQTGESAKRPRPNLSGAMRKALTKLDRSRPEGWLTFSLALLNLSRLHRPAVLKLWQRQMESDRSKEAPPLDIGFGQDGQVDRGFSILREERDRHPHGAEALRRYCEEQLTQHRAQQWSAVVLPFEPRNPVPWCCHCTAAET
jgi:hypothetical protein